MTFFGYSSILRLGGLRLGVAGVLIAAVCVCQAQAGTGLDKHARKVQHKLSKYASGHYLHLELRNNTNSYGALGTLSETSFTFTSADSNTTSTYAYNDIEKVKTDKERIGEGTEPRYHMRHLVPIVITAAALGVAAGVYAAER